MRTARPSAGGRIAAAALSAVLALGGATATSIADDTIVADQEWIEETTNVAGRQGETGSAAAQADRLEAQANNVKVTESVTAWSDGTYTASGTITISSESSSRVTCTGNVILVLEAGCKLTVPGGITVASDNTLTIRGTGELVAGGSDTTKDYCAGIGGTADSPDVGTISIEGGAVTATGGVEGAGIGGGNDGHYYRGGTINITGGTVEAEGGKWAAGIGGGFQGDGGTVSISGSASVTATGGDFGAGIGGGDWCDGGEVSITGGIVKAEGGYYGAGIGGGYVGKGGTVSITGGKVTATGVEGVGIGAGRGITSHGTLALGPGVVLRGGASENPATVRATGAVDSYDGDRYQYMTAMTQHTVSFDANGHGEAPASQTVEHGSKATKPADPTADGYAFGGWYSDAGLTEAYDFSAAVTSDLALYARWTLNAHTVTFQANGHGTAPAAQTVGYGGTATRPADPTADGYAFGGWYADADLNAAYDFSEAVTSDLTLYAKWTASPEPAVVLRFKKAKVTKTYGAKAFTNRLTNESSVKVTYESSNKKVAKVNKATGRVAIRGFGTATITATFAGDATRGAATASYRVVVGLARAKLPKTVCHPSARTVDVSWGKVKGARKYQVQWRVRGGKWRKSTTKGTELTLCGMRAGRYYEVRVRAVSGKTWGAWSTTSRRWYVPAAGVRAKSASKGKVRVSWSKTKGANEGYLVLVRYSRDSSIVARKAVGRGQTSATISGLETGRRAWVSVRPLRKAYGRTWVGVLTPIAGVRVS